LFPVADFIVDVLRILVDAQAVVPILSILINSQDTQTIEAASNCLNNALAVAQGSMSVAIICH
jgi:hypothetical protein